jgi:hypothetical protein
MLTDLRAGAILLVVQLDGVIEDGGDLKDLLHCIAVGLVEALGVQLDVRLRRHELNHRANEHYAILNRKCNRL